MDASATNAPLNIEIDSAMLRKMLMTMGNNFTRRDGLQYGKAMDQEDSVCSDRYWYGVPGCGEISSLSLCSSVY